MLTPEEYNNLLPHREGIVNFQTTRRYNGAGIETMDHTMQRRGHKPLCYSCEGNKIELINDIYNLIMEYEQSNGKEAI